MFFDNKIIILDHSSTCTGKINSERKQKNYRSSFLWWVKVAIIVFEVLLLIALSSCKKSIQIDPPVDSITSSQTFNNEANARSAIIGIYSSLINTLGDLKFGSGNITVFTGMSSDELKSFIPDPVILNFLDNNLQSDNVYVSYNWVPAYFSIYQTNAAIEGLTKSTISLGLKNQLLGEAKFIRAFCFFYLANLYGDVPLVTTTEWNHSRSMSRSPLSEVYSQIFSDLKDAQQLLSNDYSFSNSERIIPNKLAATALLARAYLYNNEWVNAEQQATSVLSNINLYDTVSLHKIFLRNSKEAIWQLQPSNSLFPFTPPESFNILPDDPFSYPGYYLTSQLLNAFEIGDTRKNAWVDSTNFIGTIYHHPAKYRVKIGPFNGNPPEYYMVLRLAEQYLIRSEARARQNKLNEAISDLNVIRKRATLPNLSTSLNQAQVLTAIEQERRVELFSEWGHRWFDLKRTARIDAVLSLIKNSNWQTTDQLYPIPQSEILANPQIKQNPGY